MITRHGTAICLMVPIQDEAMEGVLMADIKMMSKLIAPLLARLDNNSEGRKQ